MGTKTGNDIAVVQATAFLAPAVLSAEQLLARGADAHADIVIFTIDVPGELTERIAAEVGSRALHFQPLEVDSAALDVSGTGSAGVAAPQSVATLHFEPQLAPGYRKVIFLDSDVQVLGDPTPLLRLPVEPGRIAAVNGIAALSRAQGFPYLAAYYEALGVRPEDHFNAGVMVCERQTWGAKCREAVALLRERPDLCVMLDESALNAVFAGKVEPLSPRWNFLFCHAFAHAERLIEPRIIHFAGPKPWNVPGWPWLRPAGIREAYFDLLDRHRALREVFEPAPLPSRSFTLREKAREAWRVARNRRSIAEQRALIRKQLPRPDLLGG